MQHQAGGPDDRRQQPPDGLPGDGRPAADPAEVLNALLGQAAQAQREQRPDAVAALYAQALRIAPTHPKIRQNLGGTLMAMGRTDEAERQFRIVVALQPDYALPYLGISMIAAGGKNRLEDAAAGCARGLALDPSAGNVWFNLGFYRQRQGRAEEAAGCFRRAHDLLPDKAFTFSQLLLCLNYLERSGAELLAEHRRAGALLAEEAASGPAPHANPPDPKRPLRIGYLSVDFRSHLGGYFLTPLFDRHDRDAFRIHVYSMLPANAKDAVTARLAGRADVWRDVEGTSDAELAALIRRDGVDILVDLFGHTRYNRAGMLPHRPAPVQVTWLGYPNTTGIPGVDYRLVDAVSDPPGDADAHASETLVRLPVPFLCLRPPADAPDIVPLPAGRIGRVTFGSFNALAKLSPSTVRVWAELLKAVPRARLLLKDSALDCPKTADQLRRRFAAHGVEDDRLTLIGWMEGKTALFDLYNQIDIAVDPFPYNGTITSCDALWMGAPLVALRGDRHAARVGASLLTAIGLPDLIAEDTEGYVAVAAGLARDLGRLMDLRIGMRERLLASPLCDEAGFVATLEDTYRDLWARWCATQ